MRDKRKTQKAKMKALIDEIIDSLFIITILAAWLYIVYKLIKYKINPIDQIELGLKNFERKLKNIEIVRASRMDELNNKILQWAKDRELDKKGTVEAQTIKTVEELSELIKAVCKDDREEIIDAIGDVHVTLVIGNMLDINTEIGALSCIGSDEYEYTKEQLLTQLLDCSKYIIDFNYARLVIAITMKTLYNVCKYYQFDYADCVESAYNVIKNRKGKVVDGQYIKEE